MKSIMTMLAAAAASGAVAQPAPPAPPPPVLPAEPLDLDAVAAARDLLNSMEFQSTVEQTARLGAQASFNAMMRALEEQHQTDFPDALEAELRTIVDDHIAGILDELRDTALEDTARVYARYFTAEEIRDLQRLQAHPVMIKFQQVAPVFTTELAQIGVAAEIRSLPDLQRRILEAVAAWSQREADSRAPPRT